MSIILQPPAFSTTISVFLRNRGPESDLGLHSSALVSEIFEFYHLLKNALCRPGRRGYTLLNLKKFYGFEGF